MATLAPAMSSASAYPLYNSKDAFLADISSFPEAFLQTCFKDSLYECKCGHPYRGTDPYVVRTSSFEVLNPESPQIRFSEFSDIDELRQQAALCLSALSLPTTIMRQQSHLLFHLGAANHLIFLQTAEKRDIAAALNSYRQAFQLVPNDDVYRLYIIAHAGKAFHDCYGHGFSVNVGDILNSLHLLRQATLVCDEGHPLQEYIRHWHWRNDNPAMMAEAVEAFRQKALTSPHLHQPDALRGAADCLTFTFQRSRRFAVLAHHKTWAPYDTPDSTGSSEIRMFPGS
jgi:hypothetical protein